MKKQRNNLVTAVMMALWAVFLTACNDPSPCYSCRYQSWLVTGQGTPIPNSIILSERTEFCGLEYNMNYDVVVTSDYPGLAEANSKGMYLTQRISDCQYRWDR